MSVLQAEFLAKSYKSRKVVSDVSLTVNSNEMLAYLVQMVRVKPLLSTWSSV